jgi:hypothetical protein
MKSNFPLLRKPECPVIVKTHAVPLLLLLLFTTVTYSEVLSHTFLVSWDDPGYITQNPAIQGFTWHNLKLAFTSQFVSNYAPVQIVSYMLDYTFWGLKPFGFLLANLFYHFLSAVLLYFILVRLGFWKWGALLGTLLFLVHPVQVESVAWGAQRKNLLAMLFYLLAFHAWLNYRNQTGARAWKWYVSAVVFCVLSLLSKSVAIIFPLMLILYDMMHPPYRLRFRDHADKIPFLVAAFAVGIITVIIQGSEASGGRAGYPDNALIVLPMTMLPVLTGYLRMLVWPDPSSLCAIYTIPTKYRIDWEIVFAFAVLVSLIGIGVWLYRKSRSGFFWYSLFFIGLLPVSQIIPIVTRMNDRYLYFPMLGIAGLICYISSEFRDRIQSDVFKKVAVSCSIVVVVMLSLLSHVRGRVWKDTITLFSDMTAKVPNQYITWDGLAEGYRAAGDLEKALQYYEMASKHGFLREIESYHLAQIYLERGDYEKAYNHIWGLLLKSSKSGNKDGHLLMGEYYYLTEAYLEAEKQLLIYLEAVPNSHKALFTLGKVYYMMGDTVSAKRLILRARESGGETAELLYALRCLAADKECDSIELDLAGMEK